MFDFLNILKSAKRAGAALIILAVAGAFLASVAAYKAGNSFVLEREGVRIARELSALSVNLEHSFPAAGIFTNEIGRLPIFAWEFKWGELAIVDNLSYPGKILFLTGKAEESPYNLIPRGASLDNASGVLEAGGKLIFYERLKNGSAALIYIINRGYLNPFVFYKGFSIYILLFIVSAGLGALIITLHIGSVLKTAIALQKGLDRAVSGEFVEVKAPALSTELALLRIAFNEKVREFNSSDKFMDITSFKAEAEEMVAIHRARIDKSAAVRLQKHRLKTRGSEEENRFLAERAAVLKETWRDCLPLTAAASLIRGFLTLWRHDLAVSILKLREAVRSPQDNVPPEMSLIKVTSCLYTVKEELTELTEILRKSPECSSFGTHKFYDKLTRYLRVYTGGEVSVTSSLGANEGDAVFYGFKFYYIKAILFLLGEIIAFLTRKKKKDAAVLLHVLFKEEKLVVIIEDNSAAETASEDVSEAMEKGEDPLFTVYRENLAEHFGVLEILNVLHGRRYKLEFLSLGVRYAP